MVRGTEKKKKQASSLARQIRLLLLTVFICVAIVAAAVGLDMLLNPAKSWTESLAVKWISEKRTLIPFFK